MPNSQEFQKVLLPVLQSHPRTSHNVNYKHSFKKKISVKDSIKYYDRDVQCSTSVNQDGKKRGTKSLRFYPEKAFVKSKYRIIIYFVEKFLENVG